MFPNSPFSLLPSPFSILPSPFSILPSPFKKSFYTALKSSAPTPVSRKFLMFAAKFINPSLLIEI